MSDSMIRPSSSNHEVVNARTPFCERSVSLTVMTLRPSFPAPDRAPSEISNERAPSDPVLQMPVALWSAGLARPIPSRSTTNVIGSDWRSQEIDFGEPATS